MKLRIACLLLSVLLCLSLVCLTACKDEEENGDENTPPVDTNTDYADPSTVLYEGNEIFGTTLRWEIYKDGTLYIKGTGGMPADLVTSAETGANNQPWAAYINGGFVTITKLVVEDSVTALSEMSFLNCVDLQEVVLGAGITNIPYECFSNCRSLKKVVAKNVVTIEDCAFQGCKRLSSVTLSAQLSEVMDGAFHDAGSGVTNGYTLTLSGTETEWNTAKETLVVAPNGNDWMTTAMQSPKFIAK